jgi:hypothetical protein
MALTASNPVQWEEGRSVTPATNNYTGRFASAPRMGGTSTITDQQQLQTESYHSTTIGRSMTPNGRGTAVEPRTPSSAGLIRLSLKKPMGIVFEPMYDSNNATIQRGVRICDLPRTGAAALSRKLQVGDELLQINDTTVSRLTFDEIMDFIIEADPDSVNLLFRRPRKEMLQARQGVQQKLNAAANKDAIATVKWVDEEADENGKKAKKKKKSRRNKKNSVSDEDETLQSKSTVGEDSYVKSSKKSKGSKSKSSKRSNPYETESFLDMLIDTICTDSGNVCRDTFRRNDDEYISEDESFATEEDTYATYEEEEPRNSKAKNEKIVPPSKKKYEDDGTLETVETVERPVVKPVNHPIVAPLGLTPNPVPALPSGAIDEVDDGGVPAPIKELEYDDRIEADVSVMESLGGPSLLIEKQRAAQNAANQQTIPADILEKYGLDFPVITGMTREQTIMSDPVRFYTHVVKRLLQDHEPEKVRLLDKLLAKYKGREDHLVQKLSVRYNREDTHQQHDSEAFTDAVKKNKHSSNAAANVNTAKERLQNNHLVGDDDEEDDDDGHHHHHHHHQQQQMQHDQWQDKETKEQDDGDDASETGSEYSRDSVDGTSPAVIAQVSELLNYVYGKTSVPGQIDRVSTIMRAYEGREAVLLELLETKALIKANKEKENTEALPSFLRNTPISTQDAPQQTETEDNGLPPVTPMATNQQQSGTVINDDISSMSGVSSPAVGAEFVEQHEVEAPIHMQSLQLHTKETETGSPIMKELPKLNTSVGSSSVTTSSRTSTKLPPTTPDKRKKKGLFGGLFGKKKTKDSVATGNGSNNTASTPDRPVSRLRKLKGVKSVEGSI